MYYYIDVYVIVNHFFRQKPLHVSQEWKSEIRLLNPDYSSRSLHSGRFT